MRKRFDRFSGREGEREGVEGREEESEEEGGGSQEIEVTGEEVITPDLFSRVYFAVRGSVPQICYQHTVCQMMTKFDLPIHKMSPVANPISRSICECDAVC